MLASFKKLSTKILLLVSPFFLLLIFISGWMISNTIESRVEEDIIHETGRASNQLSSLMHDIQNKSLETLYFISNSKEVIDAYKQDDTTAAELLKEYAMPINDQICKANNSKTLRLHFHRAPAKSLLRLWADKRFDDLSSFRQTILNVAEKKQPLKATEIGKGGVAIRSLAPIFDNGEYLGSVELFFNPTDIIPIITGGDTLFNNFYVVNKQTVDNLFFEAQKKSVFQGTIGDYYVSKVKNKNFDAMSLVDTSLTTQAKEQNKTFTTIIGQRAVSYIPITDHSKNVIGFTILTKDLSEQFSTINKIIIGIYIVIALLALSLIFIINKLVTKRLAKLMEANEAMIKGHFDYFADGADFSTFVKDESQDEIAVLAVSYQNMQKSIVKITNEIADITQHVMNGNLDKRGDIKQFNGDYQDIIHGLNNTLDAVIKPLNVTAEYVDRISKGDIPTKISDEYKGDFNEIKNNINQLIDNLNFFVDDMLGMYQSQKIGDLDVMMQSDKLLGVYNKMAEGVNDVAKIHIDNFLKILDIMESYSAGDLTPILDKLPGKQAIANERLDLLRNTLNNIISELNEVSINIEDGKLSYRANTQNFQGVYKEIIAGLNDTLDLVIHPLKNTAEYIARISNGDIPPRLENKGKGDFDDINNNVNKLIDNLNLFIADMLDNYEKHKVGDIDAVIDASKYKGAYSEMACGVNNSVKLYISLLGDILNIVEAYANGDFEKVLKQLPGKQQEANLKMNILRTNLLNVVTEIEDLSSAMRVGNLQYNCDTSKFSQDWAKLVSGLNTMKDEVAKPVNAINDVLSKIALNDYVVEFDDNYEGLWLELQGYTKGVLASNQNVVRILKNISVGNLTDANDLKNIGKCSENDELIPSMVLMIESIQALVDDAEQLANCADKGRLDERVDESKHKGEFQKVIQGLNKTIDNLVEPLRTAASFADAISKGANFERLSDDYQGEYKVMADNINVLLNVLDNFGKDIFNQTQAAINGQLGQRSDIEKYTGNWKSMVTGMNNIMDAMSAPLNEAGLVLEELASGDLRSRMNGKYEGEFDKLGLNINTLGDSLQNLIKNVIEVVNTVSDASNEINYNSNTVASSSQEQSSQAEEIATAIEEMARTVTENATNAGKTSTEAKNNGEIASHGGKIVSDTVKKMQDIATVVRHSADNIQKLGESSQQIGQIISVIDDIADQTNLLALNAAIEAARAGEQGRGFAVVADEVRKLAERTTEATKQIATMIKGVQDETDDAVGIMTKGNDEVKIGIDLADQAGESLANIVESTNNVIEMIMQIASASEQQSATTEEIAKNITAISSVSQDTAEQISQIAEAANRMNEHTSQLNLVISQFKIDNETTYKLHGKKIASLNP